jgi:hypothetical protein
MRDTPRLCIAIALSALLAIWPSVGQAQQPSCGDPPHVDDQSLKGDLEGKAEFLSRLVGDAGLKGQIEAVRTDVFGKYPNAGTARSDAYLEYMFCSFVLSDPRLSAQEKFRAIQEFRQAETQPVQPPQASTRGDQSPAVNSKGDTTIGYGAATAPAAAGATRSPAADQSPSPGGSVRTEGNQSPAVNSGGSVGIQYGSPAPAAQPSSNPR